jgi:hypothetical protein
VGPGYEVMLGAVGRPSFGAPTGGTRGVQHRRWESWVAGDPSTSRSGARTFAGSPATLAAAQPSWVGGDPRITARPPALWSC